MTATIVPLVYTGPTGNRKIGRVHRATCKHMPKSAIPTAAEQVDPDVLWEATRATCCSVKLADHEAAVDAAAEAVKARRAKRKARTVAPAEPVAETPKEKAAKAVTTKAGERGATGRRRTFGRFVADTHTCEGACGQELAAKAFPTTSQPGVRVGECRKCRDARLAARKGASA